MPAQRKYTGYSGQMAVMSELLFHGCNAAVPVIDLGTDVFAFRDDREEVARIQVKAAQGTLYKKGAGYHAQFNIPMHQLRATDEPPIFYALAVRLEDHWVSFLVIRRSQLRQYWDGERPFGTENRKSGELALGLKYRLEDANPDRMTVRCGEIDLSDYLGAWDQLPPLRPLLDVTIVGEPPEA